MRGVARFGEAQSLRMLGRSLEAVPLLHSLSGEPLLSTEATLTLAEIQLENHETEKALATLGHISIRSPVANKVETYIRDRIAALSEPEKASVQLESILSDPDSVSESLLASVTLAIADARQSAKGAQEADDILEEFIWHHPDSPYLDLIFRKLGQMREAEDSPSTTNYKGWIEKGPPQRAAQARFYLAKLLLRNGEYEDVLSPIEGFITSCPGDPLIANAMLIRGQALLALKRTQESLRMFEAAIKLAPDPPTLGESEFACATARFQRREFTQAAALFREAGRHCERIRERAIFNSALSWGNAGDYDHFLDDYKEFSSAFPESQLRRELVLEEGLLQARAGDRRAEKTLSVFIKDFPEHPRINEARVALGELAFLADRAEDAARYIKAAFNSPGDQDAIGRAEYLAICAADSAEKRDEAGVVAACEKFVKDRPSSPLLADVRMKLGQIYFRKEDFSNARNQFELVARQDPDSRFAEGALYLAGQAALKSMNPDQAILLFDEVARMNGHLKLYARQQQASACSGIGKEGDAITLYDSIIESQPEPEMRFTSLCGKGDDLFALGAADPANLPKAIVTFDTLASQIDVTTYWRNRALYMKGKCLEGLKKTDEAAAVFYDVLQLQNASGEEPDYFWYYKSGFEAARLMEEGKQWKSAIGLYQKMAGLEGPRADEARARAKQLRLAHFIWEEDAKN